MLYRIAESADWEQARETGFFASPDLDMDGFIHASERHQILETARRYYQGHEGLMLLEIEEAALAAAGLRVEREWAESRQEYFPHVFAPVPLEAIRRTWPFKATAAGEFQLPEELEGI
ncbi:hypothetical protein PK28_12180 [Hymenobacter sp. DG25B]|uniref:DUF952 domain-containing protein n=1 Tax=Hymenobacter sp. DG25B TaxID=1385664 RepID=UPI0005408366|nr:DUF952 domain-containing protein [Hymenobacter sp. DG25B]AIZ64255.1 hypothetical protein PK28_12180 [Hymenobacter sp. DG25B]